MLKPLPLLAMTTTALLTLGTACGEGEGPDGTDTDSTAHGIVCGQTEDGQELYCASQAGERTYLRNVAYGLIPPDSSESGDWEMMVYARNAGDEACPSDGAAPTEPYATIGPFRYNESNGRPLLHDDAAVELTMNGESRRGTYNDANVLLGLGRQNPEMCTDDCYQQGGGPEFRVIVGIYFEGDNLAMSEDAFAGSMDIPHCPELDHPGSAS